MNILRLKAKVLEARIEAEENIYWKLALPEKMEFKPGQFVMVAFEGVGSKAFSICSSPAKAVGDSPYIELLAEITPSVYKAEWKKVKEGDEVSIIGPYGIFTLADGEPKVAFIAGGVGITPFKAMMDYIKDRQLPVDAVLLYSNKTPEQIGLRKELDETCAGTTNLRVCHTITRMNESKVTWDGPTGRIDRAFVEKNVPDYKERLWYVCAGPAMVAAMCTMLEEMVGDKKRVKKEAFTGLH